LAEQTTSSHHPCWSGHLGSWVLTGLHSRQVAQGGFRYAAGAAMALDVAEKHGESLSDSEAAHGWRMCPRDPKSGVIHCRFLLLTVKIQDDEHQ